MKTKNLNHSKNRYSLIFLLCVNCVHAVDAPQLDAQKVRSEEKDEAGNKVSSDDKAVFGFHPAEEKAYVEVTFTPGDISAFKKAAKNQTDTIPDEDTISVGNVKIEYVLENNNTTPRLPFNSIIIHKDGKKEVYQQKHQYLESIVTSMHDAIGTVIESDPTIILVWNHYKKQIKKNREQSNSTVHQNGEPLSLQNNASYDGISEMANCGSIEMPESLAAQPSMVLHHNEPKQSKPQSSKEENKEKNSSKKRPDLEQ